MNQGEGQDDLSGRRLVYDFFMVEASRTHERTDWFFIFHAILLEAFFAADHSTIPKLLVASLGVLTAYLWLMTGIRQRWTMMQVGLSMADPRLMKDEISSVYKGVFDARRKGLPRAFGWAAPVAVYCVGTPAAFLVVWSVLSFFTGSVPRWLALEWGALGCLLATLTACLLGLGPSIPNELVDLVAPSVDSANTKK